MKIWNITIIFDSLFAKKVWGKVPGHHQWFCGQMGSCSLKIQYLNFKSHYLKLMLVKRIGKYCILKHVNNCSCSTSPSYVYHLSPIQKQLLNPWFKYLKKFRLQSNCKRDPLLVPHATIGWLIFQKSWNSIDF